MPYFYNFLYLKIQEDTQKTELSCRMIPKQPVSSWHYWAGIFLDSDGSGPCCMWRTRRQFPRTRCNGVCTKSYDQLGWHDKPNFNFCILFIVFWQNSNLPSYTADHKTGAKLLSFQLFNPVLSAVPPQLSNRFQRVKFLPLTIPKSVVTTLLVLSSGCLALPNGNINPNNSQMVNAWVK